MTDDATESQLPPTTDDPSSDHEGSSGPRRHGEAPARPLDTAPPEADPMQVLLQASAAAEHLQQRFIELQDRRNELQAERRQLESERAAFDKHAREFSTRMAEDRARFLDRQAEVERRIGEVEDRESRVAAQLEEFRVAQRNAAEERVLHRESLMAEVAEERAQIAAREQQVEQQQQQLATRKAELEAEFERRAAELEAESTAERQALEQRVRREMTAELQQVAREKQEWEQRREGIVQEIQQQQDDLHQQREQFGEHIESERSRLRDELEKRRAALQSEQNNLQRRYRFQFEHLTRARDDLELELRQFRREQQLFRTERMKMFALHRLRFRQLDAIRTRLQKRDESLARELRVIERSRAAADAQILRKQRQFEEESEATARDLETRLRSVRQQERSAAELSTRLEERSQRLNQLRSELDRSQAEILEQRLVLEEVRAKLEADPQHQHRIAAVLDQARGDVTRFFEKLRATVNSERTRLEAVASELKERQQQLRRDRAELQSCFAEQPTAATEEPSGVVPVQTAASESLETQFDRLQEQWKQERREAERTIRELLDQLNAREIQAFQTESTGQTPQSAGRDELPGDRTAA
jgi:chromosome segregation ATPase